MHDSYKIPLAIGVVLTVILVVALKAHEQPGSAAPLPIVKAPSRVRVEGQFHIGGNVFTVVSESDDAASAAANVYEAGKKLNQEHDAKVARAEQGP
jgi:hypothetical protein